MDGEMLEQMALHSSFPSPGVSLQAHKVIQKLNTYLSSASKGQKSDPEIYVCLL